MNRLPHHELVDIVIHWVRENRQSWDLPDPVINQDTDLIASGLLDSFGFVDLVLFLETECGIKVDLGNADPAEFTVVKGLCNIALAGPNGKREQQTEVELTNVELAADLRQFSE